MDVTFAPQLIPAMVFGTVFLLVFGLQRGSQRQSARLARQLGRFTTQQTVAAAVENGGLFRQRRRLSRIRTLDSFLERKGFGAGLDKQLASADLPLRVGEYLLIRWLAALGVAAVVAIALRLPIAAVPGAAVGYMLPAIYLMFRRKQRMNRLEEQLVDALALMAGGLRAGYSFLQGAEAVVRELDAPIREEFGALLQDLRVGVQMEEALLGLAARVPSEEVDMMVTAILVQRTSGGNLAEILDTIAMTVRERMRIRREVQTLTAQERMSSYVVGALPFAAFVFLTFTNPGYLNLLFGAPLGNMLLGVAVGLELIGFFILRRIVDVKL
jgi:tight adherence protein B